MDLDRCALPVFRANVRAVPSVDDSLFHLAITPRPRQTVCPDLARLPRVVARVVVGRAALAIVSAAEHDALQLDVGRAIRTIGPVGTGDFPNRRDVDAGVAE